MARTRRKQIRHIRTAALIISAAVLTLISSVMAYFSSSDETTNRLTAAWNFSITLTEENWDPQNGVNALPGDIIPKDPRILNNGITAYVFLRVTVPCDKPQVEKPSGDIDIENTVIPLYKFIAGVNCDETYTAAQAYNDSCWTQIGTPQTENGKCVYVYAYTDNGAMKQLEMGETTETPLFDSVKLCNFNEKPFGDDDKVIGGNQNILVEALGIQSDHLGLDDLTPEKVWGLLSASTGGDGH